MLFKKKVISIDLGARSIRIVALKKKGRKAAILSCGQVERSGGDIGRDMGRLFAGSKIYSGQGTIVSDQVKFLASELNTPGAEKLSDDQLNAAAAWEMEPYLDFPPKEGIFSSQLLGNNMGGDNIQILISAIQGNVYSRFSGMLKGYGVNLQHAYSPEWATAFASDLPPEGRNKIIVDCRQDYIRGVLITPRGPTVFQTLPRGPDTAGEKLVVQIIYDLTASSDGANEVVLTGSMVSEEFIYGLKREIENIRLWGVEDLGGLESAPGFEGFGSEYATAVSAALQELRLAGESPLAVTDRVPVIKSVSRKVRENRRLVPACVLVLFFLCIAGHYASTKVSISRYSSQIKSFKVEKKRLLGPIEERKRLTEKLAEIREKKIYLENILPARNTNLMNLLSIILDLIPSDVALNRLLLQEDGSYYIEGNAYRGRSVASFVNVLSEIKFCEVVRLKTLTRGEGSDKRTKILPYHFAISLRFEDK